MTHDVGKVPFRLVGFAILVDMLPRSDYLQKPLEA
jgi:hypothetical protein